MVNIRHVENFFFGATPKVIMEQLEELTKLVSSLKDISAKQAAAMAKLSAEQASLIDRIAELEDEAAARPAIPQALIDDLIATRASQAAVSATIIEMDERVPDRVPGPAPTPVPVAATQVRSTLSALPQ
jgi:hypothetical protein